MKYHGDTIKPRRTPPVDTARRALLLSRVFAGVITLGMAAVLGRVGFLQLNTPPRIAPLIDSQRSGSELLARRGTILDRHGRAIAVTRIVPRLFVDPLLIDDPGTFSERVGYGMGYDPAWVEQTVNQRLHSRYVVIDQALTDDRIERFAGLKIPGLAIQSRLIRDYPQGPTAGQVVGFVGMDGKGLEGLELTLDKRLVGSSGRLRYWRDARRRPLWVRQDGYQPPTDGQAVRLSLDVTISAIAEQELAIACEQYDARAGEMIVMHPVTGEILAMANWPPSDPRDAGNSDPDIRRNRSVTDAFEPGSTFKPFVWAAATELNLARPDEMIDCHNGFYVSPKGRRLRDAHGYGRLTWEEVLIKSSNIGMAIVGQRMGSAKMHSAIGAFGFGSRPGSKLPGEAAGIVNPLGSWTHYSQTSVPMGQEVAVTALQLTRAFCTLANGGLLVTPTLTPYDTPEGAPDGTPDSAPAIYERVLSRRIADHTRDVLRRVVTEGTGRKADSSLYAIFGKTGTAQVADTENGGYLEGKYNSVFVCGAPFDDPQIVVLCAIHEPTKAKGYFGGIVAAPPARAVVEQTLTYLTVPLSQPPALAAR
jgi:cell division protein FtsI/penicillin-binding protein 2